MADLSGLPDFTAIEWSIAGAVGAASLSVTGKIIFDVYTRWSDRRASLRSLAAALAGEIGGYVANLDPDVSAHAYRHVAMLPRDVRIRRLAAFPPLPTGHPAYYKLSDKVGILSPDLTQELTRIYNAITSMRIIIMHFPTQRFLDADDDFQQGLITNVAKIMEDYVPRARVTVRRLEEIASGRSPTLYRDHVASVRFDLSGKPSIPPPPPAA